MSKSLKQFAADHGISMIYERARQNPNAEPGTFRNGASHWLCTLNRGERGVDFQQMVVPFSMGPAHTRPPTLSDVLSCLALDAAGIENNASFDEWASDYGYDTDSRKAKRIWRTCRRQAEELREFAGNQFETLLYETEPE